MSYGLSKARYEAAQKKASSASKKVQELLSPVAAAKDGAIVVSAAFSAGAIDAYAPEGVAGIRASAVAGLVTAMAGLALKSPAAVTAASGLLAHTAYLFGEQAYGSFSGSSDTVSPTAG